MSSINSTDINDISCVGAIPVSAALAPDSTEDTCSVVALPLPPDTPTGERSPHSSSSCPSFESLLSEVDDHELSKAFTDCSKISNIWKYIIYGIVYIYVYGTEGLLSLFCDY